MALAATASVAADGRVLSTVRLGWPRPAAQARSTSPTGRVQSSSITTTSSSWSASNQRAAAATASPALTAAASTVSPTTLSPNVWAVCRSRMVAASPSGRAALAGSRSQHQVLQPGIAGAGVVHGQLGVAQAVLGQLDHQSGQGRGGGQGPLDRLGDQVVGIQVDGQEAVRGQLSPGGAAVTVGTAGRSAGDMGARSTGRRLSPAPESPGGQPTRTMS